MDLKLDNILVYSISPSLPLGCWKISDFGISSMSSKREDTENSPRKVAMSELLTPVQSLAYNTNTVRTDARRPAGPFSAPEVELGSKIGRASDIWSFGCILFQVLARAAGGISLLNELDGKRSAMDNGSRNDHFCQRTNGTKELHSEVSKWLKRNDSLRNGALPDRVAVINCKHLILKTLSILPKGRPTAKSLYADLVQITKGNGSIHCHFDQDLNMIVTPEGNLPALPPAQLAPSVPSIIQVAPSVPDIPEHTLENHALKSDFPDPPPLDSVPRIAISTVEGTGSLPVPGSLLVPGSLPVPGSLSVPTADSQPQTHNPIPPNQTHHAILDPSPAGPGTPHSSSGPTNAGLQPRQSMHSARIL